MKNLIAVFLLLTASAFAQTTTGTAQTIGNFTYYTWTTPPTYYQPFTFQQQFNAFQPLQVPLIDTFAPARQSLYELGNAIAYRQAIDLENRRLQQQALWNRQARVNACVGNLIQIPGLENLVGEVRAACEKTDGN